MKRHRSKFGIGLAGIMAGAVGALLVALTIPPARVIKAESVSHFVSTLELPGVASDVNNIVLAFDGAYGVVAPFETSDPEHQDPFFGDNHYLVVTDLKNPSRSFKLDLFSLGESGETCYYPTHLVVSSNNMAFVRATAANSATHQPTREVIAYGQLILDKETGNPRFDGAIIPAEIRKLAPTADPGAVPIGFGVSKAGQFLVFTDGAQVVSANLSTGDTYSFALVPAAQYSPLPDQSDKNASTSDYQTITSLDVDPNNVVTAVVNGRIGGSDFSRIFFYGLREGVKHAGTFDSLAIPIESSRLAGGQVAPGSVPAVSPDGSRGYFAATNGSVWGVDLKGSPSLSLRLIGTYSSISGEPGFLADPRNVAIDTAGASLSIVRQGATVNIRRPSYGRHGGGGIRRPSYARFDGVPGLVLVYLNANGSVARYQEIHDKELGNGAYAISCPAFTQDSGAYIAASYYSTPGVLKLLDKTGSPSDVGLALPNNVGQIVSAGGSALVGIRDFDVNADGPNPKTGSLVFVSLQQGVYDAVSSSRTAIRRPCNVNH